MHPILFKSKIIEFEYHINFRAQTALNQLSAPSGFDRLRDLPKLLFIQELLKRVEEGKNFLVFVYLGKMRLLESTHVVQYIELLPSFGEVYRRLGGRSCKKR